MKKELFFPKEISSVRTIKDIEAACRLLLPKIAKSFEFIGDPTIELVSYETTDGHRTPIKYPVWDQEIAFTNRNNEIKDGYHLIFHEIDQSFRIYEPRFYYGLISGRKKAPDVPIGRRFVVSKNGKQVKTIYDDSFILTPKQAMHKVGEIIPNLKWNEIYRGEPKILKTGRAVWMVTCEYNWKYAVDIIGNPLFPSAIYPANTHSRSFDLYEHPMIGPFVDLQDPIEGKDYFAFDWQERFIRDVSNLVALRFNGVGFTPVRLSQAKLPSIEVSGTEYLKFF